MKPPTADALQKKIGIPVVILTYGPFPDFDEKVYHSLSGRVTDGQGNPIPNLRMHGFGLICGGNWLAGTDANSNYYLTGLVPCDNYIEACAPYGSQLYERMVRQCY